nr:hypothetical protein [Anabaena sp. UHCC 0253]
MTELPGEVNADANLLWENLIKLGETSLPFMGLKDLRSKLICYNNGKYEPKREEGRQTQWLSDVENLDLGSLPTTEGFKINANIQPFLINDTYAADFTLTPESVNISIDLPQLQYFKPSSLLPSNIRSSLGQTLWIYGEVDPNVDCNAIAEKFSIALVAGTNLNAVRKSEGEFFGNAIFEYQVNDSDEPKNPAKQCQIFIEINNGQSSITQFSENYYDCLLELLCSYHKIHYVYYLARQRYSEARAIYGYLDNQIQEFNNLVNNSQNQLSDFKKLLSEIPQKSLDYTRCLQDLQTHHTTITTNITNYITCLDKITAIGNGNSPQSWQDFINKDCKKWQEQVQTDINYLTPGQELFGQFVDTIRGIVETEQTESDRSLETTVQVLGIGFGGGAIFSGVIVQHIDKINQPIPIISPQTPLNPFFASLILSIIATIGCTFLAMLGIWIKKRK